MGQSFYTVLKFAIAPKLELSAIKII